MNLCIFLLRSIDSIFKQVGWQNIHTTQIQCGGSIYNESIIITAAHCCDGLLEHDIFWEFNYQIVAGELSIKEYSGYEQISKIESYVIHPGYDSITVQNDVCCFLSNSHLHDHNGLMWAWSKD